MCIFLRFLETTKKTTISLDGLLQNSRNTYFLGRSISTSKETIFFWQLYFGTQGNSGPQGNSRFR